VRHHIEASADADAVDRRDHRHFQPSQRDIRLRLVAKEQSIRFQVERRGWRRSSARLLRACGAARGVGPGAEATTGAGDHQTTHGPVAARVLKNVVQFGEHRHADRVQPLRPVERQPENAIVIAAPLGQQRLVLHR
jgi:hypothetical protein